MNAIGYIRVSTDMQVNEGLSLDAQQERIEAWAKANGFKLLSVEVDAGISGSRDDRPGLERAMTLACERRCALVVISLSRLARRTRLALKLIDRLGRSGADLVSLSERIDTTSAAGKLALTMLLAVAQHEADTISERTKAALQYLRKQGKRAGNIPYGYSLARDRKTLLANPTEQSVLKKILQMRAKGMSVRAIATRLNERGIPSKMGKKWAGGTIHFMLKSR